MPTTPLSPQAIADFIAPLRVPSGKKINLAKDYDPGYTADVVRKKDSLALLQAGVEFMSEYQARLAAQDTYGMLVCLQALDAAGKDGTIRHVMSGVNPQGVTVNGFKTPSAEELDHDYLWRYQKALPRRGEIGIFNRSHYEEVLVVRVHKAILDGQKLPPGAKGKDVWKKRYEAINNWEKYLVDNGIVVVKMFLNLSWEEQRRRFLSRIDEPDKNWKFSPNDARERAFWEDYQVAFSEMLSETSTPWAPWYVIPADHKWFMRLCASAIIANNLMTIDPSYPDVSDEIRRQLQDVRAELLAEVPPPSARAADKKKAKKSKK